MFYLQRRIDTVAEANLPLWITEMDIDQIPDKNVRADNYENVLRLYFSRPEIEGIMLWGFWDQNMWKPGAALWEGDDILVGHSVGLGSGWWMILCYLV